MVTSGCNTVNQHMLGVAEMRLTGKAKYQIGDFGGLLVNRINLQDYIGHTFGRLTVVECAPDVVTISKTRKRKTHY